MRYAGKAAALGAVLLWTLPAGAQEVFQGVARVVAVGDAHGDYEQFVKVLRLAKLVDARDRWAGGKTHLVQTGDILDRGPDSRRIMDLLMRLEEQALKAGGRVHTLIGNHEAMNVLGDLRYVSDGEFAAFGDPPRGAPIPQMPLGAYPNHRAAFSATGKYGRWLRTKNAVIKIDKTLFLHGGLSPRYATWDLAKLNQQLRQELAGTREPSGPSAISTDPDGPLWYRGLAQPLPDEALRALLLPVLRGQNAARIVMGHTIQDKGVSLRLGDQIALIDVGLSRWTAGGAPACLLIERGPQGEKVTVLR